MFNAILIYLKNDDKHQHNSRGYKDTIYGVEQAREKRVISHDVSSFPFVL